MPELIIGLIVLLYLFSTLRIIKQYERGVVFTLGKFAGVRTAGLNLIFVPIQQMTRNILNRFVSAGAPGAPSALSAAVVSPTEIDLRWTANSTNETGFVVERSLTNTFAAITSFSVAAGQTASQEFTLSTPAGKVKDITVTLSGSAAFTVTGDDCTGEKTSLKAMTTSCLVGVTRSGSRPGGYCPRGTVRPFGNPP